MDAALREDGFLPGNVVAEDLGNGGSGWKGLYPKKKKKEAKVDASLQVSRLLRSNYGAAEEIGGHELTLGQEEKERRRWGVRLQNNRLVPG